MTVIEVETTESVNNLEALAQWAPFGRLKFAFHLYVPTTMVEVARRLCTEGHIPVAEIHTYHWVGDEMRFLPLQGSGGRTIDLRQGAGRRWPSRKLPRNPRDRRRPQSPGSPRRKSPQARPRKSGKFIRNVNSFAIFTVYPRQARVRNHVACPCCSAPGARAPTHSLLVSNPARCEGGATRARRRSYPVDRRTQPRHRVRLAENPRGEASCVAN